MMDTLIWIFLGIFGISTTISIVVMIYWRIKDRKIIRELNKTKWWEESK